MCEGPWSRPRRPRQKGEKSLWRFHHLALIVTYSVMRRRPPTQLRSYMSILVAVFIASGVDTTLAAGTDTSARAQHGMVVAETAEAAAAGVEILKAGGNAVDAACASALAMRCASGLICAPTGRTPTCLTPASRKDSTSSRSAPMPTSRSFPSASISTSMSSSLPAGRPLWKRMADTRLATDSGM